MEDSRTQYRESWPRNSGVREMSAESWQHSELLSWKGSQIVDEDERVLPASADTACLPAWRWHQASVRSAGIVHGELVLNKDHHPFGWFEKIINVSQSLRKAVWGGRGTDMKTCSYFSKESWEWTCLRWGSKSQFLGKQFYIHTAIGLPQTWVPKLGFSTKEG